MSARAWLRSRASRCHRLAGDADLRYASISRSLLPINRPLFDTSAYLRYASISRSLLPINRPLFDTSAYLRYAKVSKETCSYGKRDLFTWQKRLIEISMPAVCESFKKRPVHMALLPFIFTFAMNISIPQARLSFNVHRSLFQCT